MLIPIGTPELAKVTTSKLVKSGDWKTVFSKTLPQGSFGMISSALLTNSENLELTFLSTILTNPSNSARIFKGSA